MYQLKLSGAKTYLPFANGLETMASLITKSFIARDSWMGRVTQGHLLIVKINVGL